MTDTSTKFDWADVQECIVQRQVHRVAIYDNTHGDVVIRQERDWNEEDDPFIVIARAHAIRAAHAILNAAGLGDIEFIRPCGGGYEDVPIEANVATVGARTEIPEGPFSPREVAMMARRPDINWPAVHREFDLIKDDVTELQRLSVRERRELVTEALRRDPNRSNRAIAAECGVSDKTVGAVRAEIGAEFRDDAAEIRTGGEQLRLVAAE
jgi:hypothetical protein